MSFDWPDKWQELSEPQKFQVQRYIYTLLANQVALPLVEKASREIVDRQETKGVSYQLEKIKCGKPNCKCKKGELHGPYWYAYWRDGKRVKSKYLGKNFRTIIPELER